jgi:hypothetical protein
MLHDREELDDNKTYEPWYTAPEMTFAEQRILFSTNLGPHQGGAFHDHKGGVHLVQ